MNEQQTDVVQFVFDMRHVFDYLDASLTHVLDENEALHATLSLIIEAVVDLDDDIKDPYIEVIHYLIVVYGLEEQEAYTICRNADALVTNKIIEHLPDFGGDHYYGQVSHSFASPYRLQLYVKRAAFINHPLGDRLS